MARRSGQSGRTTVDPALRVAFDHRIFVYQRHGGVSRYFAGLVEHLPEFGVEPRIIAPFHVTQRLEALPPGRLFGRLIELSPRRQRAAQIVGEALHRPLARLFDAQVVHETYYNARRIAPAGARIVVTVYDMIHELFPDLYPGDSNTRTAKAASIARADHVVCISHNTRADLLRFFPEVAERTSVVPLGFDPGFEQVASDARPHPRRYVLFVGARRDYKNFTGLLHAFAASALVREGFDLVCVGGGDLTEAERGLIGALGIGERIVRVDVDDEGLSALYRHASLFAYPSLYEGFGIPPLEAMAAGCPVVAVRASSIPEVCGDAVEYADAGSHDSLVAALDHVALSPARAEELRTAGRARITRFSWRECARATAAVYRSLL